MTIHRSTLDAVLDLERANHLLRISTPINPFLDMAELQRRIYAARGPALYFEKVPGSPFPAVCNLFGTAERAFYLFRHTLEGVKAAISTKADPLLPLRKPTQILPLAKTGWNALPRKVRNGKIFFGKTRATELPAVVAWPCDGGPFVTLPQVCTRDPLKPGILGTNMGMYRIQLSGNDYLADSEVGMHYQIHRGIGVHHSRARQRGEKLKVSIFVGGPPAHAFAAVMPLPEGVPEVAFAGALAGYPFRYLERDGWIVSADADFCILGEIAGDLKPEGPFGDHLGYYSDRHDFPFLKVREIWHRKDAVWPFTVVGRPPQEDTTFGEIIHAITGPMVPVSVPGLKQMHAVDDAGVHALLLAVGSERYTPWEERKQPMEILTIANALLGFNQVSLSKYLFIAAGEDDPSLDVHHMPEFFSHILRRFCPERDLHFHTCTTMDTLDYTGSGINQGSKMVWAAAGPPCRELGTEISHFPEMPAGFGDAKFVAPGIIALRGPVPDSIESGQLQMERLCVALQGWEYAKKFPLVVVCDDAEFTARNFSNFIWVTFTRSNPSHDVHGPGAFYKNKHWSCQLPVCIDARWRPHHAKPLLEDPQSMARVDALFAPGGELHKKIKGL